MDETLTYDEFREKVSSIILTPGGNCPVTPVVQMLQGKWKLQIIYDLCIKEPLRDVYKRQNVYGIHGVGSDIDVEREKRLGPHHY